MVIYMHVYVYTHAHTYIHIKNINTHTHSHVHFLYLGSLLETFLVLEICLELLQFCNFFKYISTISYCINVRKIV